MRVLNQILGNASMFATGAYGRKPKLQDWAAGKDFRCARTGVYFSIRDLDTIRAEGYDYIVFLDNNINKSFEVKL